MKGESIKKMTAAWPIARLGLIRHAIDPLDRPWFSQCCINQLELFPSQIADMCRGAILLSIMHGSSDRTFDLLLFALSCYTIVQCGFTLAVRRWQAAPQHRLAAMKMFGLLRAMAWSAIIVAAIVYGPPSHRPIVAIFAMGTIAFDTLCLLSIPLTGLTSLTMMTAATFGGLAWVAPDDWPLIATMGILQLFGAQFCLFNLYYMFATRRLRTRRLSTAKETIQLLLDQYDEHASDWIVEIDAAGRLVRPSSKLCAVLGRGREELDGMPARAVFDEGSELLAMAAAARGTDRFRDTLVPVTLHGTVRWWSITGLAVTDQHGAYAGFRAFVHDATEQRDAEERIQAMARSDALTGLANRAMFNERLERVVAGASVQARRALLLVEAANRISATLGPPDVAARLGGDEFALLLHDVDGVDDVLARARALSDALNAAISVEGMVFPGGASIGVALCPDDATSPEGLLGAADIALYGAKSKGRGRAMLFDATLQRELKERRRLERDLREALTRGEMEVHYQPLLAVSSRKVRGYEALLRWKHPDCGYVSPAEFIPLAEATGLIGSIGEWVLREALTEAARWPDDITIAVNVSPAQMEGEALLPQVVRALAASGLAPQRLELEITETLLMDDCEAHLRVLHRLREIGVRVALDDFGTGFSSLSYLRRFPLDKLKIDRCFVSDMLDNPDCRAIVETVLELGRRLNMATIAEGVETEEQFAALAEMGCDQVQGFLFSPAVPAARLPFERRRRPGRGDTELAGRLLPDRGPEPRPPLKLIALDGGAA